MEINEVLSDLIIDEIKCGANHTLFLTSSGESFSMIKIFILTVNLNLLWIDIDR
jgi:hypothetical protein